MRPSFCVLFVVTVLLLGGCGNSAANEPGKIEKTFAANGTQTIAQAACEGDAETLKSVIDRYPSAITDKNRNNVTPLIWALTCHGLEFPDLVADRHLNSPPARATRDTAIPNLNAIELLLRSGAEPNLLIIGDFGPTYPGEAKSWIDGYSPVLIAAEFHQPAVLRLLLQYGGDPNAKSRDIEHTALSLAFSRARWLDLGPQMSPFDDRQWDNYFLLLDAGANPSETLGNGYNVVEMASLTRPEIALRTLKNFPFDGKLNTITYHTIDAIERGFPNANVRRELLDFLSEEKGVDVEAAIVAYRSYSPPADEIFD